MQNENSTEVSDLKHTEVALLSADCAVFWFLSRFMIFSSTLFNEMKVWGKCGFFKKKWNERLMFPADEPRRFLRWSHFLCREVIYQTAVCSLALSHVGTMWIGGWPIIRSDLLSNWYLVFSDYRYWGFFRQIADKNCLINNFTAFLLYFKGGASTVKYPCLVESSYSLLPPI